MDEICTRFKERLVYTETSRLTYFVTSVINGLFAFVAVVCNAIVLNAIRSTPSLHTPSYLLLSVLAFSDLAVGLTVQPLFVVFKVAEIRQIMGIYCEVATTYMCLGNLFACLSFLTMVSISVDRFLAVRLRFKYRAVVTLRRVKVAAIFSAFVSVSGASLYLLNLEVFYSSSAILIFLSLIVASVSYFRAIRLLKTHYAKLMARVQPTAPPQQSQYRSNTAQQSQNTSNAAQQSQQSGGSPPRSARSSGFRKSVQSMLFVYSVFLLCYSPYVCSMIVLRVIGRTTWVHTLDNIGQTVVMLNSSLNPTLYYWRIKDVRRAVRQSLGLNTAPREQTRLEFTSAHE